ncbi:MAG: hypothetical protein RBT73_10510 [Spirochaetia bacterium]|jgi:hypothetical protein|nr:hypothetical protein [Spirochaetia bacterium]
MKHSKGYVYFLSFGFLFVFFFSSCATAKNAYDPTLPKVVVYKADESDIRDYGKNYTENPYLEPRTLIRGKLNEFFVVKVDFNLPADDIVAIVASAKAPSGEDVAKVYDIQSLKDFWWSVTIQDEDNGLYDRKMTAIERSCIPGFDFKQRAGKRSLYIPFIGKNPIPRPATVSVQVVLSSGYTGQFSYVLE